VLLVFGAGVAVAPSLIHALVDWFSISLEFVGVCVLMGGRVGECVELSILEDGSQAVASNSTVDVPGTPVVVATKADIAKVVGMMGSEGPGAYVIDMGDTEVAQAMATLIVLYGCFVAIWSRFTMIPNIIAKSNYANVFWSSSLLIRSYGCSYCYLKNPLCTRPEINLSFQLSEGGLGVMPSSSKSNETL
jgi:hypothetical protein